MAKIADVTLWSNISNNARDHAASMAWLVVIAEEAANDVLVEFADVEAAQVVEVSTRMHELIAEALNDYCRNNSAQCCSVVNVQPR